jgi:hypothetical protein
LEAIIGAKDIIKLKLTEENPFKGCECRCLIVKEKIEDINNCSPHLKLNL